MKHIVNPFITWLKLMKWQGYLWLPAYRRWSREQVDLSGRTNRSGDVHVMVLCADHFEPSVRAGAAGVRKMEQWCEAYAAVADRHVDSDNVPPRHTWFYRYDYPNFECIRILSKYVFKGLGEIEFHLHHGHDTPASFATTLKKGTSWFNRTGAMIGAEEKPRKFFGYIAGNWALDNGRRNPAYSGVDVELSLLREAGCYADFTFPAFGVNSQPAKVNSIYYATDTPEPKSYNTGVDVRVGGDGSGDLMIFQGPLFIDWKKGAIEYAALETFAPYSPERLDYWLKAGVRVRGRPEWIFVKLHTHGMQSSSMLLGDQLETLLHDLEKRFMAPGFQLHYVTAREAYNIVKAAEDGRTGNPGEFRDYLLPKPANRLINCDHPWLLRTYTRNRVCLDIFPGSGAVTVRFRKLPVKLVRGEKTTRIDLRHEEGVINKLHVECKREPFVQYAEEHSLP